MYTNRQNKRRKRISSYAVYLTAILITLLASVPSCSSPEAQSEHFDSNSSGMDRDHTEVHQEDTLKVDAAQIRDSLQKQ